MNERDPEKRKQNAVAFLKLLTECRDKVPNDCLEPTLNLADATVRQYVREIEKTAWTSRTSLEGYLQVVSALKDRIEEIRDNLPTGWQDFSNWLRGYTCYSQTNTPNVSTAQPPPPQPKPTVQVVPLRSDPVFHASPPAIKSPYFETGYQDIDPALLATDGANEKEVMETDTTPVFASVQNGASKVPSTDAKTVSSIEKATSETVTTKTSLSSQTGNPNNHASSAVLGKPQRDVAIGRATTASDAVGPNQKANVGLKSVGSHFDSASIFKLSGITTSFPAPLTFDWFPTQQTPNAAKPAPTSALAAPMWTPAIGKKIVAVPKNFNFYTPKVPATTNSFINSDGGSIFGNLDAGAKTLDQPFSFSPATAPEQPAGLLESKSALFKSTAGESVSVKLIEKTSPPDSSASSSSPGSATRDASPHKLELSSAVSSPDSTPSKTDPVVGSTNDGTLEMILSLLQEERAARIEAEAKRADAKMKQNQSNDEVFQRIASLEKNNSSMREAMTNKQKELDEREASVSKQEEALKALQIKLEADMSRQAAAEKAFIAKAEETSKTLNELQVKLDRMEKEAEARLAKTMTLVTSAKKQEGPVKPKVLASTVNTNDKVVSEANKVARRKRKPSQIGKILNKAFPPRKAVIVFDELKHGVLRMSKVGKAQLKDLEAQFHELLRLYERPESKREQHVSMLIDLINFGDAIGRNDDGPYHLLNAIVKDAAIDFANERLTKYLFHDNKWLKFLEVSEQHKIMQAFKTIASLGTSLFDMDLALSSAEAPDEFDDDEISATPSEIVEKYYRIFCEYDSALQQFLDAVPKPSPTYGLVKAHRECEGLAMSDTWKKAAQKFGVNL
ncbi:uncharacterized protein ALTATR162_LOCUS824 [Alternaria atra]|uniref:Uncharacterized protein n=1 Tax=Alternaria atra TaxID=119953 RepID=A0A8J2N1P9_9PLEO|nr:uncharacterized protein ALTATR162_LOCUS824 [Alternaria atra]CAG5140992.1 unnamed protein product [Alternaria atra]